MTRLTRVAIVTRKIIRYGFIATIVIVTARTLFGFGTGIYKNFLARKTPAPTVEFGKLPKLPFPEVDISEFPQFNYTVQTVEGNLPSLPAQAKVYFMPKSTIDLLSLDNAKLTASLLGFKSEAEQISPTLYRFSHPKFAARFEINIATKIFSISYDLENFFTDLQYRPPAPEVAVNQAISILGSANVLPDDLSSDTTSYEFLRVENKNLIGVSSLSEANLVKVNLFRNDYDKLPSLTSFPNTANVWFLLSGGLGRGADLIAGEYHYFPVDQNKFATYPLITSQQAFDTLKGGKAYIASLGKNLDGNVTIRKVYLAYYDSGEPMDYYQPIIAFEGDRGFTAYVPAITADYYSAE